MRMNAFEHNAIDYGLVQPPSMAEGSLHHGILKITSVMLLEILGAETG